MSDPVAGSARPPPVWGHPADAGAEAHVFVADLDRLVLDPADAHHLVRVRRLRPGDVVSAADGRGLWRLARLAPGGEGLVALDGDDGAIRSEPAPARPVGVAFAPPKGERAEWAVQKLTEVGVDGIALVVAARSVVRWDGERATRALARLTRVVREAAGQSRRARLPDLLGPVPFAEAASWPGAVLADRGGPAPAGPPGWVLVGPEGGWAPEETARGLPRVGLGSTVLRSETAAVAAGAWAVGLRDGALRSPTGIS